MELLSIGYTDKKNFLKDLEKDILETNNLELIYTIYVEIADVDIDVYAKAIIDSKDPKYNYLLAKDLSKVKLVIGDKKVLLRQKYLGLCEKNVLDSKNLEYNYLFAKDIDKADESLHAKIILDSKDPKYNYLFAKDIRNSDIEAHEKVVLDSKNPEYNYLFATTIDSADVEAHRKVVIDSQHPEYNYLFYEYDYDFDHKDVIYESRNPKYNYFLWEKYHDEFSLLLVRESQDLEYNTEIASNGWGKHRLPSKKIVLNSRRLEYICKLFTYNTFGCDSLGKFRKIGIKSKDPKYNYELVKYICQNYLDINQYILR